MTQKSVKKFALGVKQQMSQVFMEDGSVRPITVLSTGPMTVTAVKTKEKDGYKAIQVGFGERREKNIAKSQRGQFSALGNFRYVKEFRLASDAEVKNIGDKVDISNFTAGDTVPY